MLDAVLAASGMVYALTADIRMSCSADRAESAPLYGGPLEALWTGARSRTSCGNEYRADLYHALLTLACCLICWRCLRR
jgi:hypothetical protein